MLHLAQHPKLRSCCASTPEIVPMGEQCIRAVVRCRVCGWGTLPYPTNHSLKVWNEGRRGDDDPRYEQWTDESIERMKGWAS